ncbi:MAG: hypothetical protein KY476_24685, partial [Planctomycetes bacterium]|nr:hypothetical protein [Planctomycetota bacterium]
MPLRIAPEYGAASTTAHVMDVSGLFLAAESPAADGAALTADALSAGSAESGAEDFGQRLEAARRGSGPAVANVDLEAAAANQRGEAGAVPPPHFAAVPVIRLPASDSAVPVEPVEPVESATGSALTGVGGLPPFIALDAGTSAALLQPIVEPSSASVSFEDWPSGSPNASAAAAPRGLVELLKAVPAAADNQLPTPSATLTSLPTVEPPQSSLDTPVPPRGIVEAWSTLAAGHSAGPAAAWTASDATASGATPPVVDAELALPGSANAGADSGVAAAGTENRVPSDGELEAVQSQSPARDSVPVRQFVPAPVAPSTEGGGDGGGGGGGGGGRGAAAPGGAAAGRPHKSTPRPGPAPRHHHAR